MTAERLDAGELEASLRQSRLELAAVRQRNEVLSENQAASDRSRDQLAALARNLDARLTRTERSSAGLRGVLKRALRRRIPSPAELVDAQELRSSSLFDGVWYLSTYPEVALTGISPALHYLRSGASEGKDPGPDFSSKHYTARHPQIARSGANPLLNHLRTGQ